MPNQAINDSFHESCDDDCSSDEDKKVRKFQSDSDDEYQRSPEPINNLQGVNSLIKGDTMRARRAMEKANPDIKDDKDVKRIKEQTEEKRKTNIDKCMGGKDHIHDDDDDHFKKSGCQTCKELVIMCLMDILLFLFLCT